MCNETGEISFIISAPFTVKKKKGTDEIPATYWYLKNY
jgi:hypothetical protein